MTGRLVLAAGAALGAALVAGAATAQPAAYVQDGAGVPFYRFAVSEDTLGGAPDRSAMNRPLDAAARMVARDGHFWRVGADGRPGTADDERLRLYGVNLSFAANFPSAADAPRLARRLRKLGFNAVRLHHLDSAPDTRVDPPRSVLTPGPFPTFQPAAVERLRGFVDALAREGIYVNLNLRVGYRFRPAVDGVPALDGGAAAAPHTSPLYIYTPRMIALQETYARQLIRGLGLRGQPSLAMVEISNEASLLGAWQRREWQAAVPAAYAPELQRQWQQWVVQRYGSAGAACSAWGSCAGPSGPIDLLSPHDAQGPGSASFTQVLQKLESRVKTLSRDLLGSAAADEPAPTGRALRTADFLRFLADTDRRYFDRMRRVVHEETDALVPVTGTQMGYGGVLNFDSNEGQDYIDEHYYADHPDFPGTDWDPYNWRIRDVSLGAAKEQDMLFALAFRRDRRKPFVVSEYSQPFPNRQGSEAAPLIAAVAALQDWDGLFLFDYMDADLWNEAPVGFTLAGEWGKYALVGTAAQLFRTPLVAPLRDRLEVPLPAAARLAIGASGEYAAFERWLASRYGITPSLALQRRIAMVVPEGAAPLTQRLDTLPLLRDAALEADRTRGTLLLRAPQIRGFFGMAGTQGRLGDSTASVELAREARGFAAVTLASLDGQTVGASRRLLVAIGSAVRGTQPGSSPPRPTDLVRYRGEAQRWTFEPDPNARGKNGGSRDTVAPVWIERVPMQLRFATQLRQVAVYPLDGAGRRLPALAADKVRVADGVLTLQLQAEPSQTSPWYEVVAP